jgi:hypothetical protein
MSKASQRWREGLFDQNSDAAERPFNIGAFERINTYLVRRAYRCRRVTLERLSLFPTSSSQSFCGPPRVTCSLTPSLSYWGEVTAGGCQPLAGHGNTRGVINVSLIAAIISPVVAFRLITDGIAQRTVLAEDGNRTPWSGPVIVSGVVLLTIGFALYLWGLGHLHRSCGPRRKASKMPKVPRQRSYRPQKPNSTAAINGRRLSRRRMVAVVPILLTSALSLGGCSSDSWPNFAAVAPSASPTPSESDSSPPAVTVAQLKMIVARISAVAAKADADKDVELAKTRFDGPALDLRAANYAIRKIDSTQAAIAAIPPGTATVILPQQQQAGKWPRVVFTVVVDSANKKVPPVGLMLEQKTPRSNYKVLYETALEAGVVLPKVAAREVGAPRLSPDVPLLMLKPSKIALAYGDILEKGPASDSAKYFDTSNDKLIGLIGNEIRKDLQSKVAAKNGKMEFANTVGPYDSISLGTNDSGAIVAVYLNETVTVTPTQAGAEVHPENQVKTLSGLSGSTKGTVAVYGDQLLFYVPASTAKQKISLLGFTSGLISAAEAP